MAKAYETSMPANLDLGAGFTVRLTAVDPTTGNVINGITVSDFVAMVADLTGSGGVTSVEPGGPFLLVPGPGA